MKNIIVSRASFIWLVLVFLTAVSWYLGEQNGSISAENVAMLSTAMIVVGFFKVRLIGLEFMELRYAPWSLRIIFEAWVVIVCSVILWLYWQ